MDKLKQEPGEPAGTRMQVVKGWSSLCHSYLHTKLPPSAVKKADGYYHASRRGMDTFWPAWRGDHWLSLISDEDNHTALARFTVKPDGTVRVVLKTREDEQVQILQHKFPLVGNTPIENLYYQFIDKYGEPLVEHLTKESKL